MGYDWCDVLTGEINTSKCDTAERDLFYILDQLPILAFFATYALLMQFWAEVYYNAVDQIAVLSSFVKPMVKVLIVVRSLLRTEFNTLGCSFWLCFLSTQVMLFVQVLFWVFYASAWRSERT